MKVLFCGMAVVHDVKTRSYNKLVPAMRDVPHKKANDAKTLLTSAGLPKKLVTVK